jgi:hypothetical protein
MYIPPSCQRVALCGYAFSHAGRGFGGWHGPVSTVRQVDCESLDATALYKYAEVCTQNMEFSCLQAE